jgi:hypothetical protein
MKIPKKLLLSLALMLPAPLAAQVKPELPAWMTGAWAEIKGAKWSEEYWTPPRSGLMIGAGRSGIGKELLSWEATRIVIDKVGTMAFIAMPEGGPPVRFDLEKIGVSSISFINPAHDYPQRIRYWREGNALLAEISMIDGNRAVRSSYRAMGSD